MAKAVKARRPRKEGINKSQAIRDIASEMGGKPRPRDVIVALKEKGIDASPALVTNVLSRNGMSKRGRKGRRKAAVHAAAVGSHEPSIAALIEAKKLVNSVGSIAGAKKALDALSRLM